MPESFTSIQGIAAPLYIDDVDTDAIIPSRESQSVSRNGYGEKLFANWRYEPGTRREKPEFVLNQSPFRQAKVLVSGRNFGCGSSREAAVWSLWQFGIRVVVAESFGAIFRENCVRNGLLPVVLNAVSLRELRVSLTAADWDIHVDLESQTVMTTGGKSHIFSIDPFERRMLLDGVDEITASLAYETEIQAFEERDRRERPWIWVAGRKEKQDQDEH